jgi:hypothetical protein
MMMALLLLATAPQVVQAPVGPRDSGGGCSSAMAKW